MLARDALVVGSFDLFWLVSLCVVLVICKDPLCSELSREPIAEKDTKSKIPDSKFYFLNSRQAWLARHHSHGDTPGKEAHKLGLFVVITVSLSLELTCLVL